MRLPRRAGDCVGGKLLESRVEAHNGVRTKIAQPDNDPIVHVYTIGENYTFGVGSMTAVSNWMASTGGVDRLVQAVSRAITKVTIKVVLTQDMVTLIPI